MGREKITLPEVSGPSVTREGRDGGTYSGDIRGVLTECGGVWMAVFNGTSYKLAPVKETICQGRQHDVQHTEECHLRSLRE